MRCAGVFCSVLSRKWRESTICRLEPQEARIEVISMGFLAKIYPGAVTFLEENGYRHEPSVGGLFVKGRDCITFEELRDTLKLAEGAPWKGHGISDAELQRRLGLLAERVKRGQGL